MDLYRVYGGGIEYWFKAWVSCGSQVFSKSSAFTRSAICSAIVIHLTGLFSPPKVSLSDMSMYNIPFQVI